MLAASDPCLCPSEFHETDEQIELVFGMVHCVMVLENSGTSKIRVLPSLSPNLDKENFATASQWCCQQNSSTVELVDWTRRGNRVLG